MCVEIKCTESVLFAKVEAKVAAPWVPCLPVEEIEVALVVKVAEAVLDIFVAKIMVVAWEVFCW